jgi:tyrosyl-tRNA synthetase
MANSQFLKILEGRGFIQDVTSSSELDSLFSSPTTAFIGFDCTAPSLHVGSLVQLMALRWLQKTGNKPIVLLGGATTKIGDPSGKDKSRQMLSDEQIQSNMVGIKKVFEKFITFGTNPSDGLLVDNNEWLANLNLLEFLREVGPHFSINRMLTFDSVKSRLDREQSLSFLEFNYMIFQAFDFMELNKRHDCMLQIGGSDQWGNIVNGIELTRKCNNKQVFGLTTPLITNSNGDKMGKTANGAIWLDEGHLSNSDFWQFWRNTPEEDVIRFLKLFTEIPLDEINKLSELKGADFNQAKVILADAVTKLVRGSSEIAIPEAVVSSNKLVNILIEVGFAPSKTRAMAFIKGNGVSVNGIKVNSDTDVSFGSKVSFGKTKHVIVKG